MADDQHMMEHLAEKYPGEARRARTGSRSSAIKLFCKQCMSDKRKDIVGCPSKESCELWPYRIGGFEPAGTPITEPDPEKAALARARFKKGTE